MRSNQLSYASISEQNVLYHKIWDCQYLLLPEDKNPDRKCGRDRIYLYGWIYRS